MGIQSGFLRYLSKTFPDAFTKIALKDLSGKKIAINTPILMNKYKHIFRESWLVYISFFVKRLIENKIIPLFVFEGKCPDEKKEEIQKRVDKKKKIKKKYKILKMI